jgi:hypothetical protein
MARQNVQSGSQAKTRRQQGAAERLESQLARLDKDASIGPKDKKDKTAMQVYIKTRVTEAKALREAGCALGPVTTKWVIDIDKKLSEAKQKAQAADRKRKDEARAAAKAEHEDHDE